MDKTVTFSCEGFDPKVPFIEGAAPTRTTPRVDATFSFLLTRSAPTPVAFRTVFDRQLGRTISGFTAMRVTYTSFSIFDEFATDKLFCTDNANDAWRS
jgi:hypothetical protein